MRTTPFAPNEYYHLCSRGVSGQNIFLDDTDRVRFLFLILHFQSPTPVYNSSWYTASFLKNGFFPPMQSKVHDILKSRSIELVSFALMSNHFHLLVRNLDDGAVSVYMHRALTAYGKYFNARYGKRGHVFEAPFTAVHTKNNTQLLHTSAYIHKNPLSIKSLDNKIDRYPWSSYQDYIGTNRWGKLLVTNVVAEQFGNQAAYKNFVTTSLAKEKVPYLSAFSSNSLSSPGFAEPLDSFIH